MHNTNSNSGDMGVSQVKNMFVKNIFFKSSKRCLGEVSSQSEEEGFLRGGLRGLRKFADDGRKGWGGSPIKTN